MTINKQRKHFCDKCVMIIRVDLIFTKARKLRQNLIDFSTFKSIVRCKHSSSIHENVNFQIKQ